MSDTLAPKNALTPDAFAHRYGEILSMGLWGARWVGSAIVRGRGRTRKYVAYDQRTKGYIVEVI